MMTTMVMTVCMDEVLNFDMATFFVVHALLETTQTGV
jgi:hypothetical protein